MLVHHLCNLGKGSYHAGGGLGVDHADGLDPEVFVQFVGQRLKVDRFSPGRIQRDGLRAAAFGDVRQPVPEVTVAADDHGVATLQDIGAARLHAAGAGGG